MSAHPTLCPCDACVRGTARRCRDCGVDISDRYSFTQCTVCSVVALHAWLDALHALASFDDYYVQQRRTAAYARLTRAGLLAETPEE